MTTLRSAFPHLMPAFVAIPGERISMGAMVPTYRVMSADSGNVVFHMDSERLARRAVEMLNAGMSADDVAEVL